MITDIGRERLERLAKDLRSPMPSRFRWNFCTVFEEDETGCGTAGCAIGLEMTLRPSSRNYLDDMSFATTASADYFGISRDDAHLLFFTDTIYPVEMSRVTPAMVADAIDRYLGTEKVELS